MAAFLLRLNEICQIWIVEVEVVKSITRELRRTPIACLRSLPPLESLMAAKTKMVKPLKPVNPVTAEAAKRESRVEMLTERALVTAYRNHCYNIHMGSWNNRCPTWKVGPSLVMFPSELGNLTRPCNTLK